MEYSQTYICMKAIGKFNVLILILMEYSQTLLLMRHSGIIYRLNPYSNGILTDFVVLSVVMTSCSS